jgi:hypothetical protein
LRKATTAMNSGPYAQTFRGPLELDLATQAVAQTRRRHDKHLPRGIGCKQRHNSAGLCALTTSPGCPGRNRGWARRSAWCAASEPGAEDYLPKPFDATLLRARVGASLEKKLTADPTLPPRPQVVLRVRVRSCAPAGREPSKLRTFGKSVLRTAWPHDASSARMSADSSSVLNCTRRSGWGSRR